jgi:ATP-dependent protease HslVU (ClpYQ) peptidase subunit
MSVVAWDGKILAADKMATCSGQIQTITKIKKLDNGEIVAWAGRQSYALAFLDWYVNGADKENFPEVQRTEDWTCFVIASKDGVKFYEQDYIPIEIQDDFIAFGSGRDYAMAAMAMGATAIKAVEIASQFSDSCGLGVDWYDV